MDNQFDPLHHESMTCINNCGYMLVWHRSTQDDPGMLMREHLDMCPGFPIETTASIWRNIFRKGKKYD